MFSASPRGEPLAAPIAPRVAPSRAPGNLAALFLLARDPSARAAPVAVGPVAPSGAAPPVAAPDISQMSPRERFDRLYNRIMTAQEQGDQATVETFTPMALMAYAQLPEVDADAQYHLALLRLHAGDVAGAQAADAALVDEGEPELAVRAGRDAVRCAGVDHGQHTRPPTRCRCSPRKRRVSARSCDTTTSVPR